MYFNWYFGLVKRLMAFWMLLTTLILICNGLFWINDYIARPQHALFDHFGEVSDIIRQQSEGWYQLYFFLDFFWALITLIIIGVVTKDQKGIPLIRFQLSKTVASYLFVGVALLAFLFDAAEGVCYLLYEVGPLPVLTKLKIGCYAACFGFLMYWLLKAHLLPKFKSILRFLWIALFSILIILVIYILITMMPQGGTLIVDLFYNPWNIVLLFFLLAFLAIIISHYPVYSDILSYGDTSCVELRMDEKFRWLGFGTVYFNTVKSTTARNTLFHDRVVKALRRSLGILLYIALFNILLGVISRFYEVHFDVLTITLFILIVTLFIYYLEGQRYSRWTRVLGDDKAPSHTRKRIVADVVGYVGWFPRYYIISSSMVLLTAILAAFLQWHPISILFFLISLVSQMYLYIMFKISRTFLKYVYRSAALIEENPQMYHADILKTFERYDPEAQRGESGFNRLFGKLSDNVTYLKMMRFSGIVSLALIVLANASFAVASFFNPLIIILLYIILFYSLFVIAFKHVVYYHRLPENEAPSYANFFKYGLPLIGILFLGASAYLATLPNDLHKLTVVEREVGSHLDYREYLEGMDLSDPRNPANNYFFVGSYGGGLKANLWNLLLLHELDKQTDKRFFERTLVLSGVSGGAVGMGLYASLVKERDNHRVIAESIREIGYSNVLSNEVTYLLGKDLVREYLPLSCEQCADRSYKSMEEHAKNTGMTAYDETGFETYWHDIYKSRGRKFPALVINTTAVGGQQGVASTVQFPPETFAGAQDITHLENNRTLTYFGAVSTTNRFPFFSPTAKIPDRGSYLDGGYFDNSGMLSALEIYDALAGNATKPYHSQINPVFLNIINSEDFYVTQKLVEFGVRAEDINETSEFGSIIGTVTSIDKLPRYVLEKIRARGFAVELLMMPHKLSYAKIKGALKGEVRDPIPLMAKIADHNRVIDSALQAHQGYNYDRWGVVQPPLARILSVPAAEYEQAMVQCHPSVRDALKRITTDYLEAQVRIDTTYQKNLDTDREIPSLQPTVPNRDIMATKKNSPVDEN